MFSAIEKKFNVIYPNNPNATYESILNYSKEKNDPFQRWYRYKEGFSIEFVNKVIEEFGRSNMTKILDPFAGSGTTLIAANRKGLVGVGFEVNPFSHFLMSIKQQNYTKEEIDLFQQASNSILTELMNGFYEEYELPQLSISYKVFQKEAEVAFMSCKTKIQQVDNQKVKNLLFLGWLSCIEELSDYRKAGNGLKKRKTVKPIIVNSSDVIKKLRVQYELMAEDLIAKGYSSLSNEIYNESCLNFSKKIANNSIDGIIFSPPYANCFDYTEIYKLELWFGDFVSSYTDLKRLREKSLRSHLNIKYELNDLTNSPISILNEQIKAIKDTKLWDKRIPQMLYGYFTDMFNVLDNCFSSLKSGGFCAIVVGNSAYSGIIVPTDLILSLYAESIGFKVEKIEVDRYIITSSQQYEKTKENGKYLRESVICLTK